MYRDSFDGTRYNPRAVVKTKTVFNLPLKIKDPGRVFTSSLTDWAHPDIDLFRAEVFGIMKRCPHLQFQTLTKLPHRLPVILPPDWGNGYENVWLGTSVGSEASYSRIKALLKMPAVIRFISFEPLWGPVRLNTHVDWVIIGGESGHDTGKYRYRECKVEWIAQIVDDCQRLGVPVFVKQLGTHLSKELGLKDRHGGNIDEWPDFLKVREFPHVS